MIQLEVTVYFYILRGSSEDLNRLSFSISAIWDLECTDLTAGLPRFFHSGPLGEILAPLENQSLTDCGKALGDIWKKFPLGRIWMPRDIRNIPRLQILPRENFFQISPRLFHNLSHIFCAADWRQVEWNGFCMVATGWFLWLMQWVPCLHGWCTQLHVISEQNLWVSSSLGKAQA